MALDAFSQPGTFNIKVVSGDSWRREITIQTKTGVNTYAPIDLTAYTPAAQIRATASNSTVLATITTTIPAPLTGVIVLELSTAQTEALPSSAVWDLELAASATDTHTILQGAITITGDVTRP